MMRGWEGLYGRWGGVVLPQDVSQRNRTRATTDGDGLGLRLMCIGGSLWSPAGWGRVSPRYRWDEQDAGDHKGPPSPSSAALAPTDGDGLGLRL